MDVELGDFVGRDGAGVLHVDCDVEGLVKLDGWLGDDEVGEGERAVAEPVAKGEEWCAGLVPVALTLLGTVLSEVDGASILRKWPTARYRCSLNRSPHAEMPPASARYRGSDLVPWRIAEVQAPAQRVRFLG